MSGNDSRVEGTEWSLFVNDHYSQTGTYRVEDVLEVLGVPWEGFQVSAQPAVPITSSLFSEYAATNTAPPDEKPE